jgi:hypothetical protein
MKRNWPLLTVIMALFFLTACNLNQVDEPKADRFLININHQADININRVQLNLTKDGEQKFSQSTVTADGSDLRKGETLTFEVLEQDTALEGEASFNLIFFDSDNNEMASVQSPSIQLAKYKEAVFTLSGDSKESMKINIID